MSHQSLAQCAERHAPWQLPEDIIFVDQIPMTSTGKIDKKTIRAQLEAEHYQLPDQRTA